MPGERRSPAAGNGSNNMEGKGEMTKAPIGLQDLRRSLYIKAKAERAWRFWGLYIHVCKMETLQAAYQMAKANDGDHVRSHRGRWGGEFARADTG